MADRRKDIIKITQEVILNRTAFILTGGLPMYVTNVITNALYFLHMEVKGKNNN